MSPLIVLFVGGALSVLIIPLAWRFAPRLGMIDEPDPRKVHTAPIPRVGGWGIVFGTLVPIIIVAPIDALMQSYLIAGVILFCTGAWDDAKEIGHFAKFAGQIAACGVVVFYGDLWIKFPPYTGVEEISAAFGKPFTFFAMVGVINAINHSDGLDGLAGGESMLSLIVMAFLAFAVDGGELAVIIACAAIGGVLGFLRYNTHPAQVFMGDTGSQFLGFTVAFLTIYLTQVCHPALSSALPLLLIGLPIVDILAVLYLRIKGGMNWFKATRNHIHHRLLDRGFRHHEAVVIIYSVQALLVISAIFMRYQNDWLVTSWYLAVCGAVFFALTVGERLDWQVHRGEPSGDNVPTPLYTSAKTMLRIVPARAVFVMVPVYIGLTVLYVSHVPRDFGIMSCVMFVVLLFEMILGKGGGSITIRLIIFAAAAFATYLSIQFEPVNVANVDTFRLAYFSIMAICIALTIRYSQKIMFRTTPTDYLLVFGLLAIAFLANGEFIGRDESAIFIQAVILLYGCQLLLERPGGKWGILNLVTLCSLAVLGFRGFVMQAI